MIKLIGCILIISSSIFAATSYINSLKKRVQVLNSFIELLSAMKIKICYEFLSIPEFLKQVKNNNNQGDLSIFIDECLLNLNDGCDLKESWKKGIRKFSSYMTMTKNDLDILEEFCLGLGDSDIEGQVTNIKLYTEMLKKNLSQAESILKDKTKVTMSLSLFGGLVFIVLLI